MKRIFYANLIFSTVLVLVATSAFGQHASDASLPTGRALEVSFLSGKEPALMSLPPNKTTWSWFALFGRDKAFSPLPAELPVKAINIVARYSGEIAAVKVSVLRGKQFHDEEIDVANFEVRHDKPISVEELRKFGVEPFGLRLVRSEPVVAEMPSVINETRSLQANVEPIYETLPSVKARIFNFSDKPVLAIAFGTRAGKNMLASGMPQGQHGRALLNPNEYYDLKFRVRQPASDRSTEGIEFVIRSVVFADGTFEGDEGEALTFLCFRMGRKSQLRQVVPILRNAIGQKGEIDIEGIIAEVTALGDEVDENAISNLLKRFPRAGFNLKGAVTLGSKGVKREATSALKEIKDHQQASNSPARTRIAELLGEYEAFLDRLSK